MNWALAGLLCVLLVEVVSRLPLGRVAAETTETTRRAFRTLSAVGVSDHWKEKALLAYSGRLLRATLRLMGILLTVAAVAASFVYVAGLLSSDFAAFLLGPTGLIFTLVFASLYYAVRRPGRARATAAGDGQAYSAMDRILHRLALGNRSLAEMLFDLDQSLSKSDAAASSRGRHVFVTGLARSGTTILMRRFHGTGAFRSLTYRDMPFVLAPNIWARLSGRSHRRIATQERAHGDGITVDADSPESFDEAFWRVFDGKAYIRNDALLLHSPSEELIQSYRSYVGAILAGSHANRYLCKNNNNLLRLPALARAFPEALILVPFREPVSHAVSLARQHARFLQSQTEDPFEVDYMGYLGHHEFGRDHRPFHLGASRLIEGRDPDMTDYWLALWIDVYSAVLEQLPAGVRLVCYEKLCEDPQVWADLARQAGLETEAAPTETFKLSRNPPPSDIDAKLLRQAQDLYDRMRRPAPEERMESSR